MRDHLTSHDLERLEKLAVGLFINPDDPPEAQPVLFVGTIPESVPHNVPVPPHTEVLGTLTRGDATIDMVLESHLTAEEIQTFYRTRLAALDWDEPEEILPYRPGGFVRSTSGPPPRLPGPFRRRTLTFCHVSSGAGLTVTVRPQEHHTTRVRLALALLDAKRGRNPCAPLIGRRRLAQAMRGYEMRQLMPFLLPPPGARQESRFSGGGFREVYSAAVLIAPLGLEEVAKHYADQLSRAGWTQTDQGTHEPLVWRIWQFTSEERETWTGLFLALHTPKQPADYFVFVGATWNVPTSDGGLTYDLAVW